MPRGGTLHVSIATEWLAAERTLNVGSVPSGDYVVLNVADCGIGIAPEIIRQVFDPFCSTKGAGSGTGLVCLSRKQSSRRRAAQLLWRVNQVSAADFLSTFRAATLQYKPAWNSPATRTQSRPREYSRPVASCAPSAI
jgi:light-regulated signal transduction histidine kinase (bacteriophytochrome)